uniref:Reverse transcriptase domain-containing protein n=1 Tax=Caenorhabditis japonica TaxID=281687 RepID=A0A8R1IT81_CAEJA
MQSSPSSSRVSILAKKTKALLRSYKSAIRRREQRITSNPNQSVIRRLVASRLKATTSIPSLDVDGKLISSDFDKCKVFLDSFACNFSTARTQPYASSPSSPVPSSSSTSAKSTAYSDLFLPYVIEQTLLKLPPKLGFSLHLANFFVIKRCATSLALPLSIIFSHSFADSVIPRKWAHAVVVPLLKKGNPAAVSNYRPISLTDPFARVMEKIVCRQIKIEFSSSISPHQHGFLNRRSCPSSLVRSSALYKKLLHTTKSLDVIYFDFKKAFDQVPHALLIQSNRYYL